MSERLVRLSSPHIPVTISTLLQALPVHTQTSPFCFRAVSLHINKEQPQGEVRQPARPAKPGHHRPKPPAESQERPGGWSRERKGVGSVPRKICLLLVPSTNLLDRRHYSPIWQKPRPPGELKDNTMSSTLSLHATAPGLIQVPSTSNP